VDENGREETIVLSLGSRNAWELIGDEDTKVEVQGVGLRMKVDQVGKGKDKTKFKGKSGDEDQENDKKTGRQARKLARQEQAKQSKGARSGHQKEDLKRNNQEEDVDPSQSSSEESSSESSDGTYAVRIFSDGQAKQIRARIKCRQCPAHQYADYGKRGTRRKKKSDQVRGINI